VREDAGPVTPAAHRPRRFAVSTLAAPLLSVLAAELRSAPACVITCRQGRSDLPNPRPILQISKICVRGDAGSDSVCRSADLQVGILRLCRAEARRYLMGEFNGGCTPADGCREQQLLAVILQEGNAPVQRRRGVLPTATGRSSSSYVPEAKPMRNDDQKMMPIRRQTMCPDDQL